MAKTFGIIKGALRSYSDGENFHALLEIKNLIENERDCWPAYFVKGKINAALGRHADAIADFKLFLEMSSFVNERHRRHVVQSIALCATRLAERQRKELGLYFQKGPPGNGQMRGPGAVVLSTAGNGRITQVGRFLFDKKDQEKLERIMSAEDPAASGYQVVSKDKARSYANLLQKIDEQKGVVGSFIIGRDLFVRANSLPDIYDVRAIGINTLIIFLMADEQDKLRQFYRSGQAFLHNDLGYMIIQEYDGAILATLGKEFELIGLVKLADKIAKLLKRRSQN